MPTTIIALTIKSALLRNTRLIRLIKNDNKQGHYLSCWSFPASVFMPLKQEPMEDFQAENWQYVIPIGEAEQWIELLQHQTIAIMPEPKNFESRDGVSYEFIFTRDNRSLQLSWDNEIPHNWQGVKYLVEKLVELAEFSRKHDEQGK